MFSKRREEFLKKMERGIALFKGASILMRNGDSEYRYRQDSDFYYLTGCEIPDAICLLSPDNQDFKYMLFIPVFDKDKEVWIGKQSGIEEAKEKFKADVVHPLDKFEEVFTPYLKNIERIFWKFGKDETLDKKLISMINKCRKGRHYTFPGPKMIIDAGSLLHEQRLIKDKEEIQLMEKSAQITCQAHIEVMKILKPGMYEYEVEALIEYLFRIKGGTGPAYSSIVASGNNGCTLHYVANNQKIEEGALVLIDAGAEYNYYCTDITRTIPANGKFTEEQKIIYEIVLKAEKEAIKASKPGVEIEEVHEKALNIIIDGLKDLGLLKGTNKEIIEAKEHEKFFMHKTSHWLGLDVHDVGDYLNNKRILKEGMIFTVEPGIYINKDLEGIPQKYKGIGIRIEDNILITSEGCKVLTESVPKEIEEIEMIMQKK